MIIDIISAGEVLCLEPSDRRKFDYVLEKHKEDALNLRRVNALKEATGLKDVDFQLKDYEDDDVIPPPFDKKIKFLTQDNRVFGKNSDPLWGYFEFVVVFLRQSNTCFATEINCTKLTE